MVCDVCYKKVAALDLAREQVVHALEGLSQTENILRERIEKIRDGIINP